MVQVQDDTTMMRLWWLWVVTESVIYCKTRQGTNDMGLTEFISDGWMDRRLNVRDYQEAKEEHCVGSSTLVTYLAIKEQLHPSEARFRGGTGDGWKGYLIRTHERRRGGDDDSGRWPWKWMQQWTVLRVDGGGGVKEFESGLNWGEQQRTVT